MTNPTTPEDKIDAILDSLDEYSDVYRSLDIAEKLTVWPQLSKARHALLALLNEEHNNTVNEIAGFVYRELGDTKTGDAIKVYAATPKENPTQDDTEIDVPESTGGD